MASSPETIPSRSLRLPARRLADRLTGLGGGLSAPLWPLAGARILMGLLWLWALRWKLPPDFDARGETSIEEWLALAVDHPAVEPYGRLLDWLVVPRPVPFSWALFLIEAAVGMSLLLGAFTRVGAALGLLLSVNLGIAFSAVPGEWPWSYAMMAMWHATLVAADAGRLWGIDGWRRRSAQ